MNKFLSCCIAIIAVTGSSLFAQPANRAIVNQPIEWVSATANVKVSPRLTIILDGQFRYARDFEPLLYQARTGLDIKINDHLSVAPLAYVYTWNFLYGKQPAAFANHEHRIWQQLFYKHDVGRIKVDHRVRLEQRFIQFRTRVGEDVVYEGYTNRQHRLRYRFMARVSLNRPKLETKAVFASVYDEVFVSRGKKVTFHDPDQNRIFAGLGYQFDPKFTLQGGFLYQMLIKSNGALQENNVGFQVLATYNIDLSKSAK